MVQALPVDAADEPFLVWVFFKVTDLPSLGGGDSFGCNQIAG